MTNKEGVYWTRVESHVQKAKTALAQTAKALEAV